MLLAKGWPALQLKLVPLLFLLFIICVLLQFSSLFQDGAFSARAVKATKPPADEKLPEEIYLERLKDEYGLTNKVQWTVWKVQHSPQEFEWAHTVDVPLDIMSLKPKTIDVESPDRYAVQARAQMDLLTPRPTTNEVAPSDFLFGVSTSYGRLAANDYALLQTWRRWLTLDGKTTNGATLLVLMDHADESEFKEARLAVKASGIDAFVENTHEAMSTAKRYYELAKSLKEFAAILSSTGLRKKWYGLLDDSIFFPSLPYLKQRLSRYEASAELFIGIPSEREDWVDEAQLLTTYGGGAMFFSRSALIKLPKLNCFAHDPSDEAFHGKAWDVLFQQCLTKNTDLVMRVIPGFYSPTNNTYGLGTNPFEMGARPLLLHRTVTRHGLDVQMAHTVADVCGTSCFMQRFVFHDNWVLVNGVSLTHYPDGVGHRSHMASGKPAPPPGHRAVPQKLLVDDYDTHRDDLVRTERKEVWKLLDSVISKDDGAVWQTYVKRGVSGEPDKGPGSPDSAVVLIWEQQPSKRRVS